MIFQEWKGRLLLLQDQIRIKILLSKQQAQSNRCISFYFFSISYFLSICADALFTSCN